MSKTEEVPDYCQVMEVRGSDGTIKQLLFPKALDLNRPKRPRTTFSTTQLKRLEFEFEQNPYLVGREREKLAKDLGLSETQVKIWYQNKRTKLKKTPHHNPFGEQSTDKNANIIPAKLSVCQNNHKLPKPSQPFETKLTDMSAFPVFPMQQWLFHSPSDFFSDNKPNNFCSNFFC